MRAQVLLNALGAILVAVPASPALGEIVTCSDSAHVSWRADDSFTLIHGAVVRVPGCDSGETVGLQVLTTEGNVPTVPLLAAAEDDEATFDLEPHELHIEPVIGVRVLLNGLPVAVAGEDSSEGDADGGKGSTAPPPRGGVGGVGTERPAPPAGGGGVGDTPDARSAPSPSTGTESSPVTLATTGASVATLLAVAVGVLLGGRLLRRYRHRDS